MPTLESSILTVKRLSMTYGRSFSLNGIHFDLFKGEILGLLGPNGSGKTTLMEGLVGLLPVLERDIADRGRNISSSDLKKLFFYIPDGIRPYPLLPVKSVLNFYRDSFARNEKDLSAIIEHLELSGVLGKTIGQLSKGYSRRVLLAIGLISTQPILVLDEPLDGFDVKQLQRIVPLLRAEAKRGRALFVCIHQLADAERICDRFILLKNGEVVAQGTKLELLAHAQLSKGSIEEVFLALA